MPLNYFARCDFHVFHRRRPQHVARRKNSQLYPVPPRARGFLQSSEVDRLLNQDRFISLTGPIH